MSSVARCYTPLKTNIYINPKDQYEIRRDSFEIGVFDATNYYSSIMESTLTDANNVDCVPNDEKDDHSIKRHSINLGSSFEQDPEKKEKNHCRQKKRQPRSPGAKLASYLHSILNQTLSPKPKRNKPLLFEDDRKSCSMSLARCLDVAEAASVHSCPSYTSYTRRPITPAQTLANARAAQFKPGRNELRSYSSSSCKQSMLDTEVLVASRGSWPALTWFDQELKTRKEVSSNVKGLKKLKEEDGMESDSSSDLFELRNCDLKVGGSLGELAVRQDTNMNNMIKSRK